MLILRLEPPLMLDGRFDIENSGGNSVYAVVCIAVSFSHNDPNRLVVGEWVI